MEELNSFDNLTNFSNKISGKLKKSADHYRGILEIIKGEKLSLPKNLYDTRYYKIYRNIILDKSWAMSGRKLYGILGTRQTGKTVLLERLYNLVYDKSIFINVLQNGAISIEELMELLLEEKGTNIDFLFIDEITCIRGIGRLKKFYDFIYDNFKLVFITATESVKLAELSTEYLGNRMNFIPAGSDAISVRYFDFLKRIEELESDSENNKRCSTLLNFISADNLLDSSMNLSVSLQSKLDSFIIKGSSMVKNNLAKLESLSARGMYDMLLSYHARSFRTREDIIKAVLLFTYYNIIGMKENSIRDDIDKFINTAYMPTEGSEAYTDLIRNTDGRTIHEYYSSVLKSIGVYSEMYNYIASSDTATSNNRGIQFKWDGEVSTLCSNIDLVSESLWTFSGLPFNRLRKLSISLDRSRGLFVESVFCSILIEILCIEPRVSNYKNFYVYKLKYKKGSVNYGIDCVVDYSETNRLFIGIKSGKPDIEDSLKNIPGYRPDNDRIVVVSASLGDMDYNYNSGICKMSVKQFFTEYLKRWAKEVSGLDL